MSTAFNQALVALDYSSKAFLFIVGWRHKGAGPLRTLLVTVETLLICLMAILFGRRPDFAGYQLSTRLRLLTIHNMEANQWQLVP